MRVWVVLLLIAAAGYQLFFRYDRWPSHEHPGYFQERDHLLGTVRLIKPNEETDNLMARLMGNSADVHYSSDNISANHYFENMTPSDRPARIAQDESDNHKTALNERLSMDAHKIVKEASKLMGPPVPTPQKELIAATEPPVPIAMMATEAEQDIDDSSFAVRQVDLNRDGFAEEIIQNAVKADGLLDISIVKSGREIFFARGKQIKLLSSRNTEGWEDIGVKNAQGQIQVYRYSPKEGAYTTTTR